MPRLGGTSSRVRATVQHQSALWAPVTKTLAPRKTQPSSAGDAKVSMADRSLPAPSSV
jgi:hypothetical protein